MRRRGSRRSARGGRNRWVASRRFASRACPESRRRRIWSRRGVCREAARTSSPPSRPRPQSHLASWSAALVKHVRVRRLVQPPPTNGSISDYPEQAAVVPGWLLLLLDGESQLGQYCHRAALPTLEITGAEA